jgi:hypothetical protein
MDKNLPCIWSSIRSCHKDLFEDQDKIFIIGSCDPSRKLYIDMISDIIKEYDIEPVFAETLDENNNLDAFCENICSNVRGSRLIINDISAPLRVCCEEHEITEHYPSLNVYWEYGYAAGLGKKQIVICENEQLEELPFDVGSKHIQKYSKQNLRSVLKSLLDLELKKPIIKKLTPEDLDKIYTKFQLWVNKNLERNLNLGVNRDSHNGLIYDYIFGCIVPNTLSDDLIKFDSDVVKNYLDDFSIIRRSQTYKIPEYARQYDPDIGEELLVYPNGIIYFCFNYSYFNPENPEFSFGFLLEGSQVRLDVSKHKEKYNNPFTHIIWGKLESIIRTICFIFNPDCNISAVQAPTVSFSIELTVPNMIFNGKRRTLAQFGGLPSHERYLGDKNDITIHESFKYDKISELVDSIKSRITDFYKNPVTKGYSYI